MSFHRQSTRGVFLVSSMNWKTCWAGRLILSRGGRSERRVFAQPYSSTVFVFMNESTRECLNDIVATVEELLGFVSGMTYRQYVSDRKTQAAVERKFEIVGEALNRLSRVDPEALAQIRHYRSIISFRNLLAHGYDSVDDRVVWGIIESDLDQLTSDAVALLERLS